MANGTTNGAVMIIGTSSGVGRAGSTHGPRDARSQVSQP